MFEHLKQVVTEAPVLAFPDYNKPFKLVTDASGEGLGAVLYQKQDDGHNHPVAFASRRVSESESRYHPWKMEFLALKWAITERFHDYLYGAPAFHVQTDSSPLTYVLKERTKLDALGHRWVGALSHYNFSLEYIKGRNNVVADALSRMEEGYEPPKKEAERLNQSAADEYRLLSKTQHVWEGFAEKVLSNETGETDHVETGQFQTAEKCCHHLRFSNCCNTCDEETGEWQNKHFDDEDPWRTWDGSFCTSFCSHLKPGVVHREPEKQGKPPTPFEAPLLSVIKERLDKDCVAKLLAIAVSKPGTITLKHPDTVRVLNDMSDESREMLASLVEKPGAAELNHPDCITTVQALDSEDPEWIYEEIARPLVENGTEQCEVATRCMVQSLAGISRLAAAKDDWARAQKLDPTLAPIFEALERRKEEKPLQN